MAFRIANVRQELRVDYAPTVEAVMELSEYVQAEDGRGFADDTNEVPAGNRHYRSCRKSDHDICEGYGIILRGHGVGGSVCTKAGLQVLEE